MEHAAACWTCICSRHCGKLMLHWFWFMTSFIINIARIYMHISAEYGFHVQEYLRTLTVSSAKKNFFLWSLSPAIIMDLLGFHLGLYFIKQWPVADATVDPSSGSQYDKGIYCVCSALHSAYMYLLVGRWTWSRRMGRWSISTTPRSRPLLLPTHSPLLVTPKWNVRGICFVC